MIVLDELSIDRSVEPALDAFVALFEKWNRSINLSAAATRDEVLEHLVDSLNVIPYLRGRDRVLDVGSGGGFPVVVAAICLPEIAFTALEPVHKKHAFLRTAARELALQNLEPRAERLEAHAEHDYAAAMSRATFDLAEWLTMGLSYVRVGGCVIGFEAIPRSDLGAGTVRHRYVFGSKRRAIVTQERST